MAKSDVLLRQQRLLLHSEQLRSAIGEDAATLARPIAQALAVRDALIWTTRHSRAALVILVAASVSSRARAVLDVALRLWWSAKT